MINSHKNHTENHTENHPENQSKIPRNQNFLQVAVLFDMRVQSYSKIRRFFKNFAKNVFKIWGRIANFWNFLARKEYFLKKSSLWTLLRFRRFSKTVISINIHPLVFLYIFFIKPYFDYNWEFLMNFTIFW